MSSIAHSLNDIWTVFSTEVRRVFSDKAVLLIFFIGPLLYPLIFCGIYHNENVEDLPVAILDERPTTDSRRFAAKLEATPEIHVAYRTGNAEEARRLLRDHRVRAVFCFPSDFSSRLAGRRTARITVLSDMSSFYYYKAALLGGNSVLLDEMYTLQIDRAENAGLTDEEAAVQVQPVVTESHTPFNPTGGYGSFFLPGLLLMVVHQTLFLGICILCGDAAENRHALHLIPPRLRNRSTYRVIFGRTLCYLLIYIPITVFDLWLIPRWFNLPQIGSFTTVALFCLPLLLAVTFFAMTVGNLFARQKTSPMLCFVFFSVVLYFMSGMVWPMASMPRFWQAASYIFPSTPGVQGFVRITSMGATLSEVRVEYLALWLQAALYFSSACLSIHVIKKFR